MYVLELGFVVFHNSQLRELNEISIALRFSFMNSESWGENLSNAK